MFMFGLIILGIVITIRTVEVNSGIELLNVFPFKSKSHFYKVLLSNSELNNYLNYKQYTPFINAYIDNIQHDIPSPFYDDQFLSPLQLLIITRNVLANSVNQELLMKLNSYVLNDNDSSSNNGNTFNNMGDMAKIAQIVNGDVSTISNSNNNIVSGEYNYHIIVDRDVSEDKGYVSYNVAKDDIEVDGYESGRIANEENNPISSSSGSYSNNGYEQGGRNVNNWSGDRKRNSNANQLKVSYNNYIWSVILLLVL